jgi:hypothetical protein
MMIIPKQFLSFLGWQTIDPITTRMVAAALIGIGGISLKDRNGDISSFTSLLTMKIIWSGAAIFGLIINIIHGAPAAAFLILIIFAVFCFIWSYYRILLNKK